MTHDDHWVSALDPIVFERQEPPEGRDEPQRRKVRTRHQHCLRAGHLSPDGYHRAEVAMSKQCEARPLRGFEIPEQGITEDRLQPSTASARAITRSRAGYRDVDEFLGGRNGQAAEDHSLEHRE